jgi:hypothetical protein
MEFFRKLGDDLTARWRAKGNREDAFPSIAAATLRDHDAPSHVSPAQILDWALNADTLPRQDPSDLDLAITAYWSERFSIYLLFWVDGTTLIHDHSAWGAFQVLAGSSLHTTYSFAEAERVTSCAALGALDVRQLETLKRGDVREVAVGRDFIHSLFHLDRPSVSIAIFTKSPPNYAALYAYLTSGFAYVARFREQQLDRQLATLDVIARIEPERYEPTVAAYVARADPMYAFQALMQAHGRLEDEPFARVLGASRPHHPHLYKTWEDGFRELRRQTNLKERRAVVHKADHRYFLAALLNAPRRRDILRLVHERAPGREPADTIVDWVRELADVPVEGALGPTALGPPLDEVGLTVLAALLRGRDAGGVLETLKGQFDDDEVEAQKADILDLIEAFRESLFFGPLVPRDT